MVYFHNRKSRINISLSLYLLFLGVWAIIGGIYMYIPMDLPRMVALQMIFGVFAGPFFLQFSLAITYEARPFQKWLIVSYLPAVVVLIICALRMFVPAFYLTSDAQLQIIDHKLIRKSDVVYLLYSLSIILLHVLGLIIILTGIPRQENRQQKNRLWIIFFSILAGVSMNTIYNILCTYLSIEINPNNTVIMLVIAMSLIAITVMRHKAWKIESLLEIIRKNEEELAERNQNIESELDLARLIQKKLLPAQSPCLPGINVSAFYYPMDKVGGDFYDYTLDGDKLGIILADVSGHGIPGAFLGTVSKMGFQYYSGNSMKGSDLMQYLNRLIADRAVKSMFVTALFVWFDPASRSMKVTNCGHCAPLVFGPQRGEVLSTSVKGRPLGVSFGLVPKEQTIQLKSRDRILLYTDGIVESLNEKDEEFGEERLIDFLRSNYNSTPDVFSGNLFDSLTLFSGKEERLDDMSLIIVDLT